MDYYGLLFLYYLKGLSGKSVLRLFFNTEIGGTEQLLPENTSTPTTTPILADIQYPDGLRTDQYFTYRETPTTVSNKARIKTIKGNTLVWNQLVHGDFGNNYASYWSVYSGTGSVSNGVLTVTNAIGRDGVRLRNSLNLIQGHYYYCSFEYKSDVQLTMHFVVRENTLPATNAFVKFSNIYQFNGAVAKDVDTFPSTNGQTGTFSLKNVQCMDLTAMGIDNLTTVQEVEGWLSNNIGLLPYYAYNQGSLLSFNGNGIKTTGKNLFPRNATNQSGVTNGITWSAEDGVYTIKGTATAYTTIIIPLANSVDLNPYRNKICLLNSESISLVSFYFLRGTTTVHYWATAPAKRVMTNWEHIGNEIVDTVRISIANGASVDMSISPTLALLDATVTDFEPYTSSTLSLPISTYFPNGMKSAGNVYDELTESKAITRVGQITINGSYNVYLTEFTNCVRISLDHGRTDVKYPNPVQASNYLPFLVDFSQDSEHFYMNGVSTIIFILKSKCGTTAESIKAYLNSNPLTVHYELATPTETPITTEDANEALSLLMGKSVSSNNANQLINIITKGE